MKYSQIENRVFWQGCVSLSICCLPYFQALNQNVPQHVRACCSSMVTVVFNQGFFGTRNWFPQHSPISHWTSFYGRNSNSTTQVCGSKFSKCFDRRKYFNTEKNVHFSFKSTSLQNHWSLLKQKTGPEFSYRFCYAVEFTSRFTNKCHGESAVEQANINHNHHDNNTRLCNTTVQVRET